MTKCRKGSRKCMDGKCYKKRRVHHFSKKTKKRCRIGTRKCSDLKCRRTKRVM